MKSKKNSVSFADVMNMVDGLPSYEKKSFLLVGTKGSVRLAIPKGEKISRFYFYGDDDYSLVPQHPAVVQYTVEERKAKKLGGIMAEVLFTEESYSEALQLLVDAVRKHVDSLHLSEDADLATATLESDNDQASSEEDNADVSSAD